MKTTRCAKCTNIHTRRLALQAELLELPNGEGDDLIAQMHALPIVFDCVNCGSHFEVWDHNSDALCDRCHTPHNCFGQELRRDWHRNPAWHDDGIEDLEGFELAQLASETGRG